MGLLQFLPKVPNCFLIPVPRRELAPKLMIQSLVFSLYFFQVRPLIAKASEATADAGAFAVLGAFQHAHG